MNEPIPDDVELENGVKVPTVAMAMLFYIFACFIGFLLGVAIMLLII